jgi:hypothetical protein
MELPSLLELRISLPLSLPSKPRSMSSNMSIRTCSGTSSNSRARLWVRAVYLHVCGVFRPLEVRQIQCAAIGKILIEFDIHQLSFGGLPRRGASGVVEPMPLLSCGIGVSALPGTAVSGPAVDGSGCFVA